MIRLLKMFFWVVEDVRLCRNVSVMIMVLISMINMIGLWVCICGVSLCRFWGSVECIIIGLNSECLVSWSWGVDVVVVVVVEVFMCVIIIGLIIV